MIVIASIFGLSIGVVSADIYLHLVNQNQSNIIDRIQGIPDSQIIDNDDAGLSAAPTRSHQEINMVAGRPFQDPADLNTSTPKELTVRLIARRTLFNISGKKVWGESYNGRYIGPTLHVQSGESVSLTLVNKLKTATNLHFHGLHVSPSGSSDNPYISILPGHSFTYHLHIPLDQPQGTFWYHDHDMCMGIETMAMPGMAMSSSQAKGCDDLESQIFAGLSGTIVVGDDRNLLPSDLHNIPVHTLVFKDMQIDDSHRILQNSKSVSISSNYPTVRLVNGELRPILNLRPDQTELWRLANEGADIFYNLHMPGFIFTVVGQDGYPSARVTTADTLLLPPAKRFDVLITAPKTPTHTWLKTLTYHQGDDTYPTVDLMKVQVSGKPLPALALPKGALQAAHPTLANSHIAQNRTVTLNENAAGTVMYINGKEFNMNKSIFATPAVLGTVEQWTILNETTEVHPFHIHTDHFQVMSVNGTPQPYVGEQDIVTIPTKKNGVPGKVVVRIHFTDFTGKVMFHCHIAAHEDAGMMSFINVVKE